jgi:subtilase family serine protease
MRTTSGRVTAGFAALVAVLLLAGAGCSNPPGVEKAGAAGPGPGPQAADQGKDKGGDKDKDASIDLGIFIGRPPFHIKDNATTGPTGLSPAQIRTAYNLPSTGGSGTVAIIDAFDYPSAESDLATFSAAYGLPACTTANGCFEKHPMVTNLKSNSGWALEAALDIEWAHAIAPGAKVLLVESKSDSGTDLLAAVDYAKSRSDVVAVSMSWGGNEFSTEASLDSHFTSAFGAKFFASSGDSGTGVQWPAVSPNITGVGGTTLVFTSGKVSSEKAWSGSGGGRSAYEAAPAYQTAFGIALANGKRAVPDVSYVADPKSGVSVYDSLAYQGQKGWFVLGGTSAGAPQWAAIQALGRTAANAAIYADAKSATAATFFRDITTGTNGSCGALCTAGVGYDFVTGVGSPLTKTF